MRGKVIEMRKTKFWLIQIVMLTIVSLILGSPALADKPVKADKSVKAAAKSETSSHGSYMRMENANMDNGKASWKTGDYTGNDDNTGGDNTGDNTDPSGCIESGQVIFHPDGTVTFCL